MSSANGLSLKQRVFAAGAWSFGAYALSSIIRFGSNLVMTRLLVPEMFGVMAIASLILVGLSLFSDLGLKPAIIQSKRGSSSEFLNTAWTTQIIRGGILWLLSLGICLLIDQAQRHGYTSATSVYNDPTLPAVIAVSSFAAVMGGFESTKMFEASRGLSLSRISIIEIAGQTIGFLVTIVSALLHPSIWSLVAGGLVSVLTRVLMSHFWLAGTDNRLYWDRASFFELIKFGKWIFLSSLFFFIASNGDRMLLGAMIDSTLLGTYVIAYVLFSSIDQLLSRIIADVAYPALSEIIRQQPARLKNSYYRFHAIIASVTYAIASFLFLSGNSLVRLLYDSRYEMAGHVLAILSISFLTLPQRITTQCILALGVARVFFYMQAVRIIVLFAAIPIGAHYWGFQGALWGIVFSYFSTLPATIYLANKYDLFDSKKEILALSALPLGACLAVLFNMAVLALKG